MVHLQAEDNVRCCSLVALQEAVQLHRLRFQLGNINQQRTLVVLHHAYPATEINKREILAHDLVHCGSNLYFFDLCNHLVCYDEHIYGKPYYECNRIQVTNKPRYDSGIRQRRYPI